MIGYHFYNKTLRDGRDVPADGEWLTHEGPIEPCKSGLHASVHPFDALQYAPGAMLCKVELEGDLVSHGDPVDKWVGRRRCIIARFDATDLLRRFAADQALGVAHLWDMPVVVREYLTTLDETKRDAAWDAAWDAARAAARDAARDAAWDAARAAARDAARDAARAAALDALDATWAAALDAALDAAWDAARDAARAAGDAAREDFRHRIKEQFTRLFGGMDEQPS